MSCPPAAAAVSLGKTGWRTARHATLKAESVRKDRVAASVSRDLQGGAGEKDVLETVVTRHKLH